MESFIDRSLRNVKEKEGFEKGAQVRSFNENDLQSFKDICEFKNSFQIVS